MVDRINQHGSQRHQGLRRQISPVQQPAPQAATHQAQHNVVEPDRKLPADQPDVFHREAAHGYPPVGAQGPVEEHPGRHRIATFHLDVTPGGGPLRGQGGQDLRSDDGNVASHRHTQAGPVVGRHNLGAGGAPKKLSG